MKLSAKHLLNFKATDKIQRISDGNNLFFEIRPSGRKFWRVQYKRDGVQKTLSLGSYPEVSLKQARADAKEAMVLVDQGKGVVIKRKMPIEGITPKSGPVAKTETLRAVADRWFQVNRSGWVSGYAQRLYSRLSEDVYVHVGDHDIAKLTTADILKLIRRIEDRGAIETGRRILQMLNAIFNFAIGEGLVESNPTIPVSGSLAKPKPVKRRTAMSPEDTIKYMAELDGYDGDVTTRIALKLVVHTFVRTNEIRFAEWGEFTDLESPTSALWSIPGPRMKMGKPHQVPLSEQSRKYLLELRDYGLHDKWLFPSPVRTKDQPFSEVTLIYGLYRMGYKSRATIHGFRSTASTVLNENEFNSDWIEMQLAHSDSSVRGVYNAARYLRQRRDMMQWWSDFIEPREVLSQDDILADL